MDKKQLLVESFSKDWGENLVIRKLPLNEETETTIIVENQTKKVSSKWEVPVWRLGKKNLNGRTYNESLGRRVEQTCHNLVTADLADHPNGNDSGSVKDILSVSKNPHIKEGILYVDSYIVDEDFEKKLNRMTEAGYGLGVSSSVYGEVDNSGTVIDESVEVVRFFDWVLEPSYSVFVGKSNKVSESVVNNDATKTEIKEDTKENTKGENIVAVDVSKQEAIDAAFKLNIKNLMSEAKVKKTISEKIESFEDIASCLNDSYPEIKEQVEKELKELRKESLVLAEKASVVEELNKNIELKESEKKVISETVSKLENDNKSIQEKLDKSYKLLDDLKENYKKALEQVDYQTARINSRFPADSFAKVVSESTKLAKMIESKEKDLSESKKSISSLTEKVNSLQKANKELEEKNSSLLKSIEENTIKPEPKKEVKEELELDIRHDEAVKKFYEDLEASDDRYTQVKDKILKCKTLSEAQFMAMHLKPVVENDELSRTLSENTFKDPNYDYNKKTLNEGFNYDNKEFQSKRNGWF